jgi:hypothetical protein
MKTNVQLTIGQALHITQSMALDVAASQRNFLSSYMEDCGTRGVISVLLKMADADFKFDWKDIYSNLNEDEEDNDSDSYVKYAQAWHEGTFPVHILHADVLTDDAVRNALVSYAERVSSAQTSIVTYNDVREQAAEKFLSYNSGSGVACSTQRNFNKRVTTNPVGHIAFSGTDTPASLYAKLNNARGWARDLSSILNKALKKDRFTTAVIPVVNQLVEALEAIKKIKPVDGEGYNIYLMSDAIAQQVLNAVDAIEGLAASEIREVLIRSVFVCPPSIDCDPSKKVKKLIKEHGAVLTDDLVKRAMKEFYHDCDFWECIALLDVVGIAHQYVRDMTLVKDGESLAADWLSWSHISAA